MKALAFLFLTSFLCEAFVPDPFESHFFPPDPAYPTYVEEPAPPLEPIPPEPAPKKPVDAHILFDLEGLADDFVLEVKQIELPNFFGAFNPSIVRWQNSFLMSFRIRDPLTGLTHKFGLVYLDEHFNPIGEPQIIELPPPTPYHASKFQDPRLVIIARRLFLTFSNVLEGSVRDIRRMYFAEISSQSGQFVVETPECISRYPEETEQRWEKNWVPFDYNNHLFLAYSLIPHRILAPLRGTNIGADVCSSKGTLDWDWGVLRGGSPALLENGEYLSFFHSSVNMPSVHSNGKNIQHYFMGAYTFSMHPPFGITRISHKPIIGKQFYHGRSYKTWKPLHVVFPAGFISDEKYIWVVYGRQDFEIWVAKLDKQGLFNSLVPVTSVPE